MFILSNKKILALVAMAACMATLANAEGTRARAKRRELKASKSSKKKEESIAGQESIFVEVENFLAVTRPETNINLVTNSFSYSRFDRTCPNEAADIVSCSGNAYFCKMCVVGQANLLENGSWKGMNDQCLKIGKGHCEGCRDDQILDYYNCGTGRNMTVAGNMTITGNTTVTGNTTDTPVSLVNPGDGVTAEIQSGNFIPGAHPNTEGGPPCPWEEPVSGGECDTLGYEHATCFYAGLNNTCSCWWNQPMWSCVQNP